MNDTLATIWRMTPAISFWMTSCDFSGNGLQQQQEVLGASAAACGLHCHINVTMVGVVMTAY